MDDRASDPRQQVVVVAFPVFEQADQKRVRLIGSNVELEAIQAQENIRSEKGDTLVSRDFVGSRIPSTKEEIDALRSLAKNQKNFPLLYFSKNSQYGGKQKKRTT